MDNILTVDLSKTRDLALLAGKLVFKKEAEVELLKLLELQTRINEYVEMVKDLILESGETIAPNFKGVIGEKIRCIARQYGGKYTYAREIEPLVLEYLDEVNYLKVNSEKVDKYFKDKGELPEGIIIKDREKKLSITLTNETEKTED